MNNNLKTFSGINVLTKKELRKVFAGTNPDCEEGFESDGNGGCVPIKTENSGGQNTSSPRCDRA